MKIQYVSDLHPSGGSFYPHIKCVGDILVIAGDSMGKPDDFKNFILQSLIKWKQVLYVPGNHDFYSRGESCEPLWEKDISHRRVFDDIEGAYYLNRDNIILDNIKFIGSCLWSSGGNVETKYLHDFRHIYKDIDVLIDMEYVNMLFQQSYDYIKREVDSYNSTRVCITHFPPINTGVSPPKYEIPLTDIVFLNERDRDFLARKRAVFDYYTNDMIKDIHEVTAWIYGHTHYSNVQMINGCYFVSNQYGYQGEDTGFKEDSMIELF